MTISPAQLLFDLDALVARAELQDRRRRPTGGAERLLVTLIRQGLDQRAYRAAAALVLELELDQPVNQRQVAIGSDGDAA